MLSYIVGMLEKLHISPECDGFLFLAESSRNPPVLKPHRHIELELNLVKAGAVSYVVDNRTYHFPRGSLIWIFPDQLHQLVDRTPDAAYYVAVFRPRLIRQSCRTNRYAPLRRAAPPGDGVPHFPVPEHQLQALVDMMESLTQDGQDADVLNREAGFGLTPGFSYRHGDPDALNAGLRHLLLSAWRLHMMGGVTQENPRMHPLVQEALRRLDDPELCLSLPELAKECGSTPATLSRLFKRDLGIPFSRYRNSVRLAQFMRLWHNGPRTSILECMHQAGFGSYPQFYRVFRDTYGSGPKEMLKFSL
jgi:AraC-like DNA-binding protein